MESFLVFYVILALLVGLWNRNRGNSFWVGFLLSCLLSPLIGAIVVGIMKKNPNALIQREMASGEMKKCPVCAELVENEAIECRFCHTELL
jgi:hypothetical protein